MFRFSPFKELLVQGEVCSSKIFSQITFGPAFQGWLKMCVCVCVCGGGGYMCVCVRARRGRRWKERETEKFEKDYVFNGASLVAQW